MRNAFLFAVVALAPLALAQAPAKPATGSPEQQQAVADAMRRHSYPIAMKDGKLTGPGADFLAAQAAKSQFVIFGEEHYVKEFPEFLTALFAELHQRDGFQHLASETDPVSAHVASLAPRRGDRQKIADYARRYPNAFTFPSDQELEMFADVGRISTAKPDVLWGLDQSFGALHALDRLQSLPGFRVTPAFQKLYAEAEQQDSKRVDESGAVADPPHFIANVAKPSDWEMLRDESRAPEGSEARFILDNLVSSAQIYGDHYAGRGYENGYDREQQMKQLFLRGYHLAQAAGEKQPRVVVKLGHWHTFRGIGPSQLQTLGNFLTEFATANGMDALDVGVYMRGAWRDVSHQKGLEPIALATAPDQWTIIDFRALRSEIGTGKFGHLDPMLARHIYGFDAALVMGGATEGTTRVIQGGLPK